MITVTGRQLLLEKAYRSLQEIDTSGTVFSYNITKAVLPEHTMLHYSTYCKLPLASLVCDVNK